jgi:hypothetical protein
VREAEGGQARDEGGDDVAEGEGQQGGEGAAEGESEEDQRSRHEGGEERSRNGVHGFFFFFFLGVDVGSLN